MDKIERQVPFKEPSDDELIQKVKEGDSYSYDLLVKRYQRRIYFLAYRMVGSHETADDIAQETFIKAYFAIESFKIGHSFYTWLYRICMNLSINSLKRRRLVIPESQFKEEANPLERRGGGADPSERFALKEMEERIESAIDSLPPKYKAVLLLRVYEELSYEEIAETLEITEGTVMSRLFRARERMHELLKEYKEYTS
jgi:RNA polymerase sigma-70 factor (ECF subfamily)